MSAAKQDHSGHRKRKKDLILKKGSSSLSELDLLEVLLYYAVPRADTRPIAEKLLEAFGSVEAILEADQGEISKIDGIKDSGEMLFILLREVLSRYGKTGASPSLLEPELMKAHLLRLYEGITAETVYALYFTHDGQFIDEQLIFRGGVNSAKFSLRLVTEGVFRAGGNAVVLAHNHPSGSLIPSSDDIMSTKRIAANLAANDITLIEHYIVGKNDCVGFFAEDNYYL